MAQEEQVFAEVMNLLEAETSRGPAGGVVDFTAPGPDIPALREQLAVLLSTGKAKDAIRVQLTHECLSVKRYETYVGANTTDSLIDSCIFLATKVVGMVVNVKDIDAYQRELRNDYIISNLAGNLALKCGRFLALASSAMITTTHIDLNRNDETNQKKFPSKAHQLLNNF